MKKWSGIAFEGGDVAGLAHLGVYKYMYEHVISPHVTWFAGSSIGALVAVAAACRIPYEEVEIALLKLDYGRTFNGSHSEIKDLYRFIRKFGWNKGNYITQSIGDLLKKQTGDSNITLNEIWRKYGNKIAVVVTDVGTGTPVYFNTSDHGDIPALKLIRMSMSIPFVYMPVQHEGHMYIDGGVLNPSPMKFLYNFLEKDKVCGVRLLMEGEYDLDNDVPRDLISYAKRLIKLISENNNSSSRDGDQTMDVHVGKFNTWGFSISISDKKFLIRQGEMAAEDFFNPT